MGDGGASFDVESAAAVLRERLSGDPEVLLVLGSGLWPLANAVEDPEAIPFEEVPGLPGPAVAGHEGRWVAGTLEGRTVLVQSGRFHYYEGHGADVVTAPVRLAARLGVATVILTNAAGGIAPTLVPGDIMLVEDHVNLMWRSPLAGPVFPGEERFPDMSSPYDLELQALARTSATELGIPLERGTYAALLGPSYETSAEIRMLGRMGIDAVGMSTVPEVIAARAAGLRALAFSLITNKAAGLSDELLGHDDVVRVGHEAAGSLKALIRRVVARLPE